MTRRKKREISLFDEVTDPELRELVLQIQEDRRTGKIKEPPRTAAACHSMEDLCLYIFKLAHLDGSYQMLKTDTGIQRWVWFGHDFGDRFVKIVEKVLPQIKNSDELKELRLVATRVSDKGFQRLQRAFPKAQVTIYTDEDDHANWQLSQADYTVL